jgi:hypothetical protein
MALQLSNLVGEESVESVGVGVTLNTSAAATANQSALEAWSGNWDATGRRRLTAPAGKLYVDGDGYVIPASGGGCLLDGIGGLTDVFGSTETALSNASVTRIIGSDLDVVVDSSNVGGLLTGVSIWGYEAATRIAMLQGSANWSRIGLLVRDGSPAGTGQLHGHELGFLCHQVGLQCGTDDNANQADNLNFSKLLFTHCGTGFRLRNEQSVNHRIGECHFYGTETCFDFVHSCDMVIQHVYVGAGDRDADGDVGGTDIVGTVFKTTGFVVENSCVLTVLKLALDGTATGYKLVDMTDYANPSASNSFPVFNILSCRLPSGYTGVSVLRGAGQLNLSNATRVTARMVQCHSVTDGSTYNPVVNYTNCRFASGVNTDELIHASSTGTCTIKLTGCTTATGGRVTDATQTWINGVKQ